MSRFHRTAFFGLVLVALSCSVVSIFARQHGDARLATALAALGAGFVLFSLESAFLDRFRYPLLPLFGLVVAGGGCVAAGGAWTVPGAVMLLTAVGTAVFAIMIRTYGARALRGHHDGRSESHLPQEAWDEFDSIEDALTRITADTIVRLSDQNRRSNKVARQAVSAAILPGSMLVLGRGDFMVRLDALALAKRLHARPDDAVAEMRRVSQAVELSASAISEAMSLLPQTGAQVDTTEKVS